MTMQEDFSPSLSENDSGFPWDAVIGTTENVGIWNI